MFAKDRSSPFSSCRANEWDHVSFFGESGAKAHLLRLRKAVPRRFSSPKIFEPLYLELWPILGEVSVGSLAPPEKRILLGDKASPSLELCRHRERDHVRLLRYDWREAHALRLCNGMLAPQVAVSFYC